MRFRDNLKLFREKAGYSSAKEFAAAIGIPYSQYSAYESPSRPREPKYDTLCQIATALNCTTDELLGREKRFSYYELRCMHLENKLKNIASIASDV